MSNDKTGAPGEGAKKFGGNQKVVIGILAAILVVMVIASSFAIGYFIGHQNGVTGTLTTGGRPGMAPPGGGGKQGQSQGGGGIGGGAAGERIREMIQSGEAELVRGDVTSVEEGKVTVQTAKGSETIALTDNTRYPGRAGEVKKLEKGQKVTVLVRRGEGGNVEALAVRIMGTGPEF